MAPDPVACTAGCSCTPAGEDLLMSQYMHNPLPTFCLLAGVDGSQRLSALLAGQNRSAVEGCTRKCVPTCVRGGSYGGAPGLGPISLRKEIVVFKDGFRSRQYCLSE
jgi:hypothetical protein